MVHDYINYYIFFRKLHDWSSFGIRPRKDDSWMEEIQL
jgi:hypothetical protein